MIVVNKDAQGKIEVRIREYDYFHPSQGYEFSLDDNRFKSIDWNILFVKESIPLYLLDQLAIKYNTRAQEEDNNYVIHRDFPCTIIGNELVYYRNGYIDPAHLYTSYIIRFEYFMRFINFMLPIPNQEEMDFIHASLSQEKDDFPLSIACTYNLYYFLFNLKHKLKFINMYSPEREWISNVMYDYNTSKAFIDLYIQKNYIKNNKISKQ